MKNEKNLFLLDINSHINRAFHKAKSNGANERNGAYHNGKPTWVIEKALDLIENEISKVGVRPDYIGCILDHRGKNFRHEIYPDYKGTRPPTDPELVYMRECIFKLLHLKGYHVMRKSGVEADDVIATLARKASAAGINTYILTKDKDMFYLINDNTFVFNGIENKLYDANACFEKKGVYPNQMIDYLTMEGDSADNIIGIPQCGPKTTKEILKHHTLDDIVEDPELLQNKSIEIRCRERIINYIKENKDFIKLMNTLVKMKENLDLKCSLKDFIKKNEDDRAVSNAFNKLGLQVKPNRRY